MLSTRVLDPLVEKVQEVKARIHSFIYNLRWSDYVTYIDGWIPKLSLSVPIIGYLILFNDTVANHLSFTKITGEENNAFGLSGVQRLKFLYFGLISLGISNIVFRIRKPYAFRFGTNISDYSRTCLDVFTLSDFTQIHNTIRENGHLTKDGKYYDHEWEGFRDAASDTDLGKPSVTRDGNWEGAKSRYGGLLRGMLSENFFREDIGRRDGLVSCLVLSSFGYLCIVIPSIDLFLKVLRATLT